MQSLQLLHLSWNCHARSPLLEYMQDVFKNVETAIKCHSCGMNSCKDRHNVVQGVMTYINSL